MDIEAVTFYKMAALPSRSCESSNGNGKLIRISLPRLKFLEDGGVPYRPEWAVSQPKREVQQQEAEEPQKKKRDVFRREKSTGDVSDREVYAASYRREGLTYPEIGLKLDISKSAAKDAVNRYRIKTGKKVP